MIYTVTLNPSIDCIVYLSALRNGELNRAQRQTIRCGGKGINVSTVLQELGVPSVALGFVAGRIGEAIEKEVADMGIATDFVHLRTGESRINVKISEVRETEINGPGPGTVEEAFRELQKKMEGIGEGDVLVLSGKVAEGMPEDSYARILRSIDGRGVKYVVDAQGEALKHTLAYRPFLVKPNLRELGEIFETELNGRDAKAREAVVYYARKLKETGARNVLVSMGGDGALLLTEAGKILFQPACEGKTVNTVGAGDSMLAAFLAAFLSKEHAGDCDHALRLAVAAGAAAAFSDTLATAERIRAFMR